MQDDRHTPEAGRWGRAAFSGMLSLLMPGLGQVHARSWQPDVVLLGMYLLLNVVVHAVTHVLPPAPGPTLVLFAALVVCFLAFNVGSALDAVRRTPRLPACRARHGSGPPGSPRWSTPRSRSASTC